MSFDTVTLKKGFEPLDVVYWRDVGFSRARNGRLVRNDDRTSMTVYQKGYGGKDWLMAQASLPKIVFGHNAMLPNELQAREAAWWLCGYVSSETGLIFTIDNVKTFRIDYTRDYDILQDRAHAVALALLAKDIPNFTRANRNKDSVCFEREQGGKVIKQLEVYPKFTWATDKNERRDIVEACRGKLRLEVRLIRKGLNGIKGASKPFDYLSQSLSDSILNEAANMLDLQRIIDARNIDFQERLIVHGCRQRSLGSLGLPTFVELVKRHGEKFYLKPDFHYPRSTFYKRKKELIEMGIWGDLVTEAAIQSSYE